MLQGKYSVKNFAENLTFLTEFVSKIFSYYTYLHWCSNCMINPYVVICLVMNVVIKVQYLPFTNKHTNMRTNKILFLYILIQHLLYIHICIVEVVSFCYYSWLFMVDTPRLFYFFCTKGFILFHFSVIVNCKIVLP